MRRYSIGDRSGALRVEVIPYGATIVAIDVPDRDGHIENVVLHYDDSTEYEHAHPRQYFGATIGRYANRIANAEFQLNGRTYRLSANEGRDTLHGGARGFDAAVWEVHDAAQHFLTLSHVSPDGDQGFPGTLTARVTFAVRGDALAITYKAACDADTAINLTNHSYFNLSPGTGARAADHVLQVFAGAYTPLDDRLIPTGEIRSVEGTRFNFRNARPIGEEPYDMNFVLGGAEAPRTAALLGHPGSGRIVEVLTTEPGVQIYTGNPLGVAMETQHFADSPHHPNFPSTILRAGEEYVSATVYRFLRST